MVRDIAHEQRMQSLGYTGGYGGGQDIDWLSNQFGTTDYGAIQAAQASTPGVMPVGVEPLHEYERAALESVGSNPFAGARASIDPLASSALSSAGPALEQALAEYTRAGELSREAFDPAALEQYMNPFREAVTDRTIAGLSDEAQEIRNRLTRQQGTRGAASFGGLRQSQQLGDLNEDYLDKVADTTAGLNYQSYDDAVRNYFGQRDRSVQGTLASAGGMSNVGAGFGNIASQAQGVAGQGLNQSLQGRGAQQAAGQNIRGFNQALSDIALQDFMGAQTYDRQNLQSTLGMLPTFQSGTSMTYQDVPSGSQQLGAGLSAAGQVLGAQNLANFTGGGFQGGFDPSNTYYNPSPGTPLPWLRT